MQKLIEFITSRPAPQKNTKEVPKTEEKWHHMEIWICTKK